MDPNWRQPDALRPTLRHLMLLVVHFAFLFALVAPLLRAGLHGLVVFLVPPSPHLLAEPRLRATLLVARWAADPRGCSGVRRTASGSGSPHRSRQIDSL